MPRIHNSIDRTVFSRWSGVTCLLMLIIWVIHPSFKAEAQTFERLNWSVQFNGSKLSMPFTGGLHNPQFSNMDFNGDGIQDLLVFDRDGNVIIPIIIEDDGTGIQYSFAPQYKDLFPDIINWMLIRDYNGDEVPDIFTGTPSAGLQGLTVYKGHETSNGLSFEQIEFPDQAYPSMVYFSFQGSEFPIYIARIDVPGVIDVDEDGDLDLLTFEEGGGVRLIYYENQSVEMGYGRDSLIFNRSDECWGKFIESPFNDGVILSDDNSKCAERIGEGDISTRHAGSTVLPVDINQDGALDVLIGDNGSPDIVYMRNGQESEDAFMVEKDITYPSDEVPAVFPSFLATFHVDTDADEVRELLVSPNSLSTGLNTEQVWKYQRGGEGGNTSFQFVQNDFLLNEMLDLSGATNPTWVDVNGDDRLDLVVGVHGYKQGNAVDPRLFYFRQTGSPSSPEFELIDDDFLNFSSLYDDPSSTDSKYEFAPEFADMDGDGDLDVISGEFWGTLVYGENTAGAGQPISVDELQKNWMDIDVGQNSDPLVYDFNGDGLKDLIIGERTGNSQGGVACGNLNYFENQGTSSDPMFVPDPQQAPNDPCFGAILTQESGSFEGYSAPALIPISNEEELLVGANSGKLIRYSMGVNPGDSFSTINENWGEVSPGSRSTASVADVDKDGIFEMIVGNNRGGLELFQTDLQTDGGMVATNAPNHPVGISVHPNPTDGQITVRNKLSDSNCIWKVFSPDGTLIRSGRMKRGEDQRTLNLSHSPDGLYILQIIYPDGRTVSRKIIKAL